MASSRLEFQIKLIELVEGLDDTHEKKAILLHLFGNPKGDPVVLPGTDEKVPRGIMYEDFQVMEVQLQAIGDVIDEHVIEKVNELIDEYNQLRLDYNSSTVPTTASAVDKIT